MARSGVAQDDIEELLLGNVVSAGTGLALPRQVSLGAGLPERVGGTLVNKACGSGMKSVMLAANAILAGAGELYVAGGTESMSRAHTCRMACDRGINSEMRPCATRCRRTGCGAVCATGAWATQPNSSGGN